MLPDVVTSSVADVSEITFTDPTLTPDTPVGVNVGAENNHDVPVPVNVTVVTAPVLIMGGDTASPTVTPTAGSYRQIRGSPNDCVEGGYVVLITAVSRS